MMFKWYTSNKTLCAVLLGKFRVITVPRTSHHLDFTYNSTP